LEIVKVIEGGREIIIKFIEVDDLEGVNDPKSGFRPGSSFA
jgi:hypothetical protein